MTGTSWDWPEAAAGLRVTDVDGLTVGRVVRVDEADELIDVELRPRVNRRVAPAPRVVSIPFVEILDVDDHEVTLREEARYIVHPEERPREPVGE